MKTVLTVLAALILVLFSSPSFALSPLEDQDLASVTAQSGVSLAFDEAVHLEVEQVAWGDQDGLPGVASGPGWVGVKQMRADFRVRVYYYVEYGL